MLPGRVYSPIKEQATYLWDQILDLEAVMRRGSRPCRVFRSPPGVWIRLFRRSFLHVSSSFISFLLCKPESYSSQKIIIINTGIWFTCWTAVVIWLLQPVTLQCGWVLCKLLMPGFNWQTQGPLLETLNVFSNAASSASRLCEPQPLTSSPFFLLYETGITGCDYVNHRNLGACGHRMTIEAYHASYESSSLN